MEFLLFVVFSSMEYLAIFAIMFALFRFEYKFYHNSVIFICGVLSFVSYSLRYGFEQEFLGPIVHILLIFAFLYYIFQVQVFYAGVMSVTGFLAYVIIQTITLVILNFSGVIKFGEVQPNTWEGYLIQIISCLLAFSIIFLIKRKNFGFAYVPHGQRAFVAYKGLNKIFLYFIILGTIATSILFELDNEPLLLIMTGVLIAIFIIIIYLSIRKEYSND
jgi:hypothetical protein